MYIYPSTNSMTTCRPASVLFLIHAYIPKLNFKSFFYVLFPFQFYSLLPFFPFSPLLDFSISFQSFSLDSFFLYLEFPVVDCKLQDGSVCLHSPSNGVGSSPYSLDVWLNHWLSGFPFRCMILMHL